MGFLDKIRQRKKEFVSQKFEENLGTTLNEEKRDMIRGVVDLSETSVKEVMIPRIDVDFLSVDVKGSQLLQKIAESGHSRFPVYRETIDDVAGILYVKDLINLMAKNEPLEMEKVIRKPFFVPESKRIDALLREFKRRHVHIAVAVDEYGGVSGIVCMEDIIEEIVGDIQDEFDNEQEDVLPVGDGVWLCDARASLDDLADIFGGTFPSGEFDTLGGFVFNLFGKIPVRYEKVSWDRFDFIIQAMDGHRITTVKIMERKDPEASA
ncbi:MAG: HlyC/CorC family transporter [Spirochaetes bacterium]|uniref:HlyC/CorC family transporter n=1 Tax=Candidatus Avitreponema avistercoris TaxID=2840705 RepID=A0A9D9EQ10_9SPIR|nr:HlyC/CorC family transporter [Candidatus Avitreponema avistercoris]